MAESARLHRYVGTGFGEVGKVRRSEIIQNGLPLRDHFSLYLPTFSQFFFLLLFLCIHLIAELVEKLATCLLLLLDLIDVPIHDGQAFNFSRNFLRLRIGTVLKD